MTGFLSYWRHSKTSRHINIYLNYSSILTRISRKTCGCDRLESLGSLEETHEVHVQEPVLHQNHHVTHRVHPTCKKVIFCQLYLGFINHKKEECEKNNKYKDDNGQARLSDFTESIQGWATYRRTWRPKANVVVAFEMETAEWVRQRRGAE
jgi:hypothetical protein